MTRSEQVAFCKKCVNRKFDPQRGIICGLTMEPAQFSDYCQNFIQDTTVMDSDNTKIYYGSYGAIEELPNLASKTQRFLNRVVDNISIVVFMVFLLFLLGAIGSNALNFVHPVIFILVAYFSFYIFFELVFQQTPGKMLTKTKVVTHKGQEPNFGDILLRTVSRFIPFDLLSFLGDGPGWHDTVSNTRVIDIDKKVE